MKKTVLSFNKETPVWAKWLFRIVFALTTGLTAYIAASNLFSPEVKYETTLILKLLVDPLVYAASKMFGVKRYDKPDTDHPH